MQDFKLKGYKKIFYFTGWCGFIPWGLYTFGIFYLVPIFLYWVKADKENKKKRIFVMNHTYQKFIFVFGNITFGLSMFMALLEWGFQFVDYIIMLFL